VALVYRRRFNRKDFRRFHPGGTLGSRLSREVGEVMLKGDRIPLVSADQTVREALFEMDEKKVGACLVVDDGRALLGVVTDGDIRRSLLQKEDIMGSRVHEIMSPSPKVIVDEQRVADAIELMERDGVAILPVVDKGGKVAGVIHLPLLLGHEQRGFHTRNEAT
jgi:arabinose-5-phosphate isomerase